jgi:hypothetical protein
MSLKENELLKHYLINRLFSTAPFLSTNSRHQVYKEEAQGRSG